MKWLVASATLLAIGLIAAGVLAGRTLRARDAAVREGLMTRAAHELERELRDGGPEAVRSVLARAIETNSLAAIELRVDGRLIGRAGVPEDGQPLELPVFLGPSWRVMAGGMAMTRGGPPFRVRLWASPAAGDSSSIAAVTTWSSIVAALALLLLAVGAARGLAAQQRAESLEAERGRLQLVSGAGAGLAHRIRNPLATIKATAQIIASQSEGAAHGRATRIVDASVRIESLIDELLRFARPVEVHAEDLDLVQIAQLVVPRMAVEENVRVHADREHVTSAIEELVANASTSGGGEPEVTVGRRGRNAVIEVKDRGPGLQIDAERAFQPYVTTRPDGTGLGLASIRGLIRANGGEVTLAGRPGGGCVATILLPAVTA